MQVNKKIIFFVGFVLVLSNAFSQTSSPIIGYDKVQWGASIQNVTQAYPTIREITSDDSDIGVKAYIQRNVGNGISERRFYFFNSRLYKVAVDYEEQSDPVAAFLALADRLVAIYGKFDTQNSHQSPSGNYVLKFLDFIRNYNNNLEIFLRTVDVVNRFNNVIENSILVIYSNPVTESEIEVARRRYMGNNLGL